MGYIVAPAFGIRQISWELDRPSGDNTSGWTGTNTEFTDPWHGKWRAHVALARVQGQANAATLKAFLAKCKGRLSTFQLPATESAQNSNSGVIITRSLSAGATAMPISGAATPVTAGQMVTINDQLLQVTDAEGGWLYFEPPLREDANSATPVETANPYALVRMVSPRQGWSIETMRLYGIEFDVEEAVKEPIAASRAISLEFMRQRYYVNGARKALLSSASGYSFSRTGTQTAYDTNGGFDSFSANDPAINQAGFHCFESVTNHALNSQAFGSWTLSTAAVTADATTAPDGTTTADRLADTNTGTSGSAAAQQNVTFPAGSGARTFSVYAKAGSVSWIRLAATSYSLTTVGAANASCYFDLTNGVLGTASNGTGRIVSVGSGWYLCILEFSLDGTDNAGTIVINPATANNTNTFTRDGTHNIFVWQGQTLTTGGFGDAYIPIIPTAGSATNVGASDLEIAATLPDDDFIAWAVINTGTLPTTASVPFAYSTAGGGGSGERLYLNISAAGTLSMVCNAGGVSQSAGGNIVGALTSTGGRLVVMVRRKNGAYSIAAKKADGTVTIGSDAATTGSVPAVTAVEIGARYNGDSQVDCRVEGFFQRNGRFSDADISTILAAA